MPTLTQTGNSQIKIPALFNCSSPEETQALGERIATLLKKGSIVALKGALGAGKTCLAKGIAKGLGVKEELNSPSYTIVNEYVCVQDTSAAALYHIDAYRLNGNEDFTSIGGEEIVFGNGISLIEWCERIPAFIPNDALKVEIEIKGDNERHIHVYMEIKVN